MYPTTGADSAGKQPTRFHVTTCTMRSTFATPVAPNPTLPVGSATNPPSTWLYSCREPTWIGRILSYEYYRSVARVRGNRLTSIYTGQYTGQQQSFGLSQPKFFEGGARTIQSKRLRCISLARCSTAVQLLYGIYTSKFSNSFAN